jgi:putative membrane protein
MFWFDHGPIGWGWAVMSISMVLFWALVVAAVVFLARGFQRRGGEGSPSRPNPRQLLAERFARGEIDEDEYRQRLAVLTGQSATEPPR